MIAFAPLADVAARPVAKVCGLRSIEHARVAASGGAALIGLIFAPSKRRIEPEAAAALVAELRRFGPAPKVVGVFVNEDPATVNAVARLCKLDAVQLSGDETADVFAQLELPVIVALRMRDDERERGWLDLARRFPDRVLPLVDAHVAGSYGGAGVVADWPRAAALAREMPLLLAGGLTPDNVAEAIAAVKPLGVDVSSGVESDGVKDAHKIARFLNAVQDQPSTTPSQGV